MSVGENVFDKFVKGELTFQFKHRLPVHWSVSSCRLSHSKIPLMLPRQECLSIQARCKERSRPLLQDMLFHNLVASGRVRREQHMRLRQSPVPQTLETDSQDFLGKSLQPSCTNTFIFKENEPIIAWMNEEEIPQWPLRHMTAVSSAGYAYVMCLCWGDGYAHARTIVGVDVHACTCNYGCRFSVCMWRSEDNVRCQSSDTFHLLLATGSLVGLEICLQASRDLPVSTSHLQVLGLQACIKALGF